MRGGFRDRVAPSGRMCDSRKLLSISSRFCAAFESTESRRFRFLDARVEGWKSDVELRARVIDERVSGSGETGSGETGSGETIIAGVGRGGLSLA